MRQREVTVSEGLTSSSTHALRAAHERFARLALGVYLGAAAVALALLVLSLVTDRHHEEDEASARLMRAAELRADALGHHIGLLNRELQRLGRRSELDLFDEDLRPEASLLELAHEGSTFFNVGVAILDPRGTVAWSEPSSFLGRGVSFAGEPWFQGVSATTSLGIVPIAPERPDSLVYFVRPIQRDGHLAGALVGAVDFSRAPLFEAFPPLPGASTRLVIATQSGAVVYPPQPPSFAASPDWLSLFNGAVQRPRLTPAAYLGEPRIVAIAPIETTELSLLCVARRVELTHDAKRRFGTRLVLGLLVGAAPLLVLVLLLRRSLRAFWQSEEGALREANLRLLGEASSGIAHEIKNALNGLGVGLELLARRDDSPSATQRRQRVLAELRREIERLTAFTSQLMTFSRGMSPRRTPVDLGSFLAVVTELSQDSAAELGVELSVAIPEEPLEAVIDRGLVHAAIANLVTNAFDALTGRAAPPRPTLRVTLTATTEAFSLEVADNGPGPSASMRARLFLPFQTDKPNGVGLGLAFAQRVARAHGGDLTYSEGAPGARFTLSIPREPT